MKKLIALLLSVIMLIAPLASYHLTAADNPVDADDLNSSAVLKDRSKYGSTLPFTDVVYRRWDYAAIAFGYNNGFINGTSATTFAPTANITRGQFVTLIGSMEKIDKSSYTHGTFPDVKPSAYYASFVNWASKMGIVAGMGDGTFAPDRNITREQLALLMYRYAEFKKVDVSKYTPGAVNKFSDSKSISAYARTALDWAVSVGVVSGAAGKVMPLNTATRAEAAVMLYKLVDGVVIKGADMANVEVSRAISSQMVVQRCEPVNIWGTAKASENGKYVHASLYGAVGSAVIENGLWKITLDGTFPACSDLGNSLLVWGDDSASAQKFENILVGDVYLIAGQSNVHFNIKGYETDNGGDNAELARTAFQKVKYDKNSTIRMFRSSMLDYIYIRDEKGAAVPSETMFGSQNPKPSEKIFHTRGWQTPFDEFTQDIAFDGGAEYRVMAAKAFSAVGYIYAYRIQELTGVPVGMIEVDASGLNLSAFMPGELTEGFDYPGRFYVGTLGFDVMMDRVSSGPSRFVYNRQIHPLRHFSLAGLIWYQGESDWMDNHFRLGVNDGSEYFVERFTKLMTYLRGEFGNSDWPVFIVELPSCYNRGSHGQTIVQYIDFSKVRTEMGTIPNVLDDSYVITSSDLWGDMDYWNNIHPYCKYDQARRLAECAFAVNYVGGDAENTLSPTMRSVEYKGNSVVINYEYVGKGLDLSTEETDEILGFEICIDPDWKNWDLDRIGFSITNPDAWVATNKDYGTTVEITGNNQVTITSDKPIYGVRYNCNATDFFPLSINLMTKDGMPANSFASYSPECGVSN